MSTYEIICNNKRQIWQRSNSGWWYLSYHGRLFGLSQSSIDRMLETGQVIVNKLS